MSFVYSGYNLKKSGNELKITYFFTEENVAEFKPEWSFFVDFGVDMQELNTLAFYLGMVELVSYWKACCTSDVKILCGDLSKEEIEWWKKLYFNGLSEFYYRNNIKAEFKNFMNITCFGEKHKFVKNKPVSGFLIPIGGGKDSTVTLELLNQSRSENTCYAVNKRGAITDCVTAAGYSLELPDFYGAKRTIDKNLIELNKKGYLNGHTPFSAVLAFSSLIAAYILGKKFIALSNESSANEVYVNGTNVNHQYSKSFEFENDFRFYAEKYIFNGKFIEYFSLLRSYNEYNIVKEFVKYPKYFKVFKSCNAGSKTDSWCCNCSKCLYVYIMLSAFLENEILTDIFGENLLEKEDLLKDFNGLVSDQFDKPFECVGTREEINCALCKTTEKHLKNKRELPFLLDYFQKNYYTRSGHSKTEKFHDKNNNCNIIKLEKIIKQLENKKVLILGYGKEGVSSHDFLNKFVPSAKITVADKTNYDIKGVKSCFGEDYLKACDKADIIIKSPGIMLGGHNYENKLTSQTELFLSAYSEKTIGITGTKGKSTTTALIYHCLKENGKNAVLLGNIGIPPLSVVENLSGDEIFVFEMSCHQLEFAKTSPHISVFTNLYNEHLDYYKTFEKYKNAKDNIYKHQRENDFLIHNSAIDINAASVKIPVSYNGERFETVLKGEHNMYNIKLCAEVCKLFGIATEETVKSFKGLPHRLEFAGNCGGINYYNDSISTIPETTMAAVKCFEHVDTLLLGGMDRGVPYNELCGFLKTAEVDNIICMYELGGRIFDMLKYSGKRVIKAADLKEAVEYAKKITPENGVCLLSPAAASYGYFKNFEERGEEFCRLINIKPFQ